MNNDYLSDRLERASVDVAIQMLASSADLVGKNVFPALVEGVAKALSVRWVFLAQPFARDPTKAATIAAWNDGPSENIEYDLAGSPCADIMDDGACCFSHDVRRLFPDDQLLRDMGAESYVGIPLRSSSGNVIGLLAALDDKPIESSDNASEILALFAGRAASEIERVETSSANERLGRIVEDSVSEAYVFDGESYRFQLVNRGARENLGYSLAALRDLTPWDLKPEYTEEDFRSFVAPLKAGKVPFLEFETIHERKDGSHYHVSVRLQYFGGAENVFFASIFDITDRKMAEERERLLMREVNHRAKNLLSIVQVIARQTATSGLDDFSERFEERIAGLAASHDLLVACPENGVNLNDLMHAQLAHFSDLFGSRIQISGPGTRLKPIAAQSLGMALHELATNSAKYGALSNDIGSVHIKWDTAKDENGSEFFALSWLEKDGPRVVEPARRGFGSKIIESALSASLRGKVELSFAPAGLKFHLSTALPNIVESESTPAPAPRGSERSV